jgi:hypothetical protein
VAFFVTDGDDLPHKAIVGGSRVPSRWSIAALVAASAVCSAGPASAQAQRVPLSWNAPPGCPTAAEVVADVDRNLAAAGERRAAFVAVVDVTEGPKGLWQAHLRVEARGGQAERRFEAESCAAIASATALIIALAAQVGDGGQAAAAGAPLQVKEDVPQPARVPSPDWQRAPVGVVVSGLVDGGIMPKVPAVGLEAAAVPSWTTPGWRLRVLAGAGFFFFPRSADVAGAYGHFWRLAVSGRGCASAGARVEVGLCVGAELSAMHATGPLNSGLADDTVYWFSPAASGLVSWNVDPGITVLARCDVTVPVPPGEFHSDNGGVAYTVPAVAVGGALGVELHFR